MELDREPTVLLHGDLHHDNILRGRDGQWLVIDPQGVAGPAFLEAGRFIQNHVVPPTGAIDLDETSKVIQYVSSRLEQPWGRIARTLFLLHLLSMCWSYEMNESAEELGRQKGQCVELRRLAVQG
jgi:streptomycin 6-kinase